MTKDEFQQMMNETNEPVRVCGLTFELGDLLAKMDPVAFDCMYNDFVTANEAA